MYIPNCKYENRPKITDAGKESSTGKFHKLNTTPPPKKKQRKIQ